MVQDARPGFARAFPRDPDLDALLDAFTRGDYARVRVEAPALAGRATDQAVKDGAAALLTRTQADPLAKLLLLLTLALLVFLSAWWIAHDGPRPGPQVKPAPTVERMTEKPWR